MKALRPEPCGSVRVIPGDPGAERECEKYRFLYTRATNGLPRGPPLAAPRMRPVIGFAIVNMFSKKM